jgi:7-cyano-7-deazaguanine synthase
MNIRKKSIVLLSAGLDSTVNLYMAQQETEVVGTLTFNYGQRAALKEIECAQKISQKFAIPHTVIDLPWLKNFGSSSLTNDHVSVPTGNEIAIDNVKVSLNTAKAVWVPNRNGIFLNIAAGLAEGLKADLIIPGFNAEEAQTFPDNSAGFVETLNSALTYSTAYTVQAQCYTIAMNKNEIVRKGLELKVSFVDIWPCYFSYDKWCGQCESCQRAKRAFQSQQLDYSQSYL